MRIKWSESHLADRRETSSLRHLTPECTSVLSGSSTCAAGCWSCFCMQIADGTGLLSVRRPCSLSRSHRCPCSIGRAFTRDRAIAPWTQLAPNPRASTMARKGPVAEECGYFYYHYLAFPLPPNRRWRRSAPCMAAPPKLAGNPCNRKDRCISTAQYVENAKLAPKRRQL